MAIRFDGACVDLIVVPSEINPIYKETGIRKAKLYAKEKFGDKIAYYGYMHTVDDEISDFRISLPMTLLTNKEIDETYPLKYGIIGKLSYKEKKYLFYTTNVGSSLKKNFIPHRFNFIDFYEGMYCLVANVNMEDPVFRIFTADEEIVRNKEFIKEVLETKGNDPEDFARLRVIRLSEKGYKEYIELVRVLTEKIGESMN